MGVYIKDMEMPKNCRQCSLYLQSMDRERNVYENCAVTAKSYNWGLTTRPSDCPLVPVQKHGRLIDADALAEHRFVCIPRVDLDGNDVGRAYKLGWNNAIEAVMENAETIIGEG